MMAAGARFPWRFAAVLLLVALAVLVARWPLAWATPWLPAGMTCAQPAGSIWRGRCEAFSVAGMRFDATTWELRALPLLHATLAATVDVRQGADRAQGEIELRPGGRVAAQHVEADLTLGAGLLRDSALGLRGRLHASVQRAEFVGRSVGDLVGVFTVRDLTQGGTRLGDFEVRFDPAGSGDAGSQDVRGTLRDLGGPLGVEGRVTLTRGAGYVIEGLVTLRADTPPALARQIAFLGRPDAAGRRPFSIAGTY